MSSLATEPTTALAPATRAADRCFWACWAVVAAGVAGLGLVLQPVWASKPELADRFLIPTAAAWLIYRAWPRVLAARPAPAFWGLGPLLLGAGLFAVGWYVAVQVSGRPLVVWWLVLSFIVTVLGLTVVHAGRHRAACLLFPLAFCLFSLPTPGRLYNPLQSGLKKFTTNAAERILPWLAVPVERPDPEGYDLVLPSGSLGVVEACSGVRSITALTAIAVLVAYLRGFGIFRGLTLVGLTMGVVALSNALRVIITGLLQEFIGMYAIQGWAHEALGVAVILVGLAMIVALSRLLLAPGRLTPAAPGPPIPLDNAGPAAMTRALLALAILGAALGGCLWAEQFREDHRVAVRLPEVSLDLPGWKGEELKVKEAIQDELYCDQIFQRVYLDPLGQPVTVWVMFWANAATTAHMHHPDICYPSRGWKVTQSRVPPVELPGLSACVPVSMRHMVQPAQQQMLFFWTQHGSRVLPEGLESPELFSGHSWVFRILQGHTPIDRGARVSVLIGTEPRGSLEATEKLLRDFTAKFAAELYRVCPWGVPRTAD